MQFPYLNFLVFVNNATYRAAVNQQIRQFFIFNYPYSFSSKTSRILFIEIHQRDMRRTVFPNTLQEFD